MTKKEMEVEIERYRSALNYIALLSNMKNPHLGHPRLSDTDCIFCMAYFALHNGAYGYEVSKEDYDKMFENKKNQTVNLEEKK